MSPAWQALVGCICSFPPFCQHVNTPTSMSPDPSGRCYHGRSEKKRSNDFPMRGVTFGRLSGEAEGAHWIKEGSVWPSHSQNHGSTFASGTREEQLVYPGWEHQAGQHREKRPKITWKHRQLKLKTWTNLAMSPDQQVLKQNGARS